MISRLRSGKRFRWPSYISNPTLRFLLEFHLSNFRRPCYPYHYWNLTVNRLPHAQVLSRGLFGLTWVLFNVSEQKLDLFPLVENESSNVNFERTFGGVVKLSSCEIYFSYAWESSDVFVIIYRDKSPATYIKPKRFCLLLRFRKVFVSECGWMSCR